jgi:hypothetical protein
MVMSFRFEAYGPHAQTGAETLHLRQDLGTHPLLTKGRLNEKFVNKSYITVELEAEQECDYDIANGSIVPLNEEYSAQGCILNHPPQEFAFLQFVIRILELVVKLPDKREKDRQVLFLNGRQNHSGGIPVTRHARLIR